MKKKSVLIMIVMVFLMNTAIAFFNFDTVQPDTVSFEKSYADDLYLGNGSYIGGETEVTSYVSKTDLEYEIPFGIPIFFDGTAAQNACAVNCGSVVVGYYNKDLNLIPGFDAIYYVMGNIPRWNNSGPLVQAMINNLYVLMKTDPSPNGGTTVANYKSGLTKYASNHGYSTSITSRMSSGFYNYTQIKQSVLSGKPVSIFMSGYNVFLDVHTSGKTDTIYKALYSGNHVMIVYGYRDIYYYDNSTILIKHHRYLRVYTSFPDISTAYIKLDDVGKIDDAYEIVFN